MRRLGIKYIQIIPGVTASICCQPTFFHPLQKITQVRQLIEMPFKEESVITVAASATPKRAAMAQRLVRIGLAQILMPQHIALWVIGALFTSTGR